MPYCTNCGYEVTSKMLFCPQCGSRLAIPKAGAKDDKTYDYSLESEDKKAGTVPDSVRKSRLYKQWIQYAGLPHEETPPARTPKNMPARGERNTQSAYILYILFGVIILILCTGLVFLLLRSWQ